jgi:hypothetical protein
MRGHYTSNETSSRSAIAAVKRRAGCTETTQPNSIDLHVGGEGRDHDAKAAEHFRGRAGVIGLEYPTNPRFAVGERREDQRAVRDGLVTGHAHGAGDPQRSQDSSAVAASVFSSRYFTMIGV